MNRHTAVVAGLVLAVSFVSACGPTGTRFAVEGALVLEPEAALASAAEVFDAWSEDAVVSREDEAACYLDTTADDGREGDFHVEPVAWCGPALTLEHDERYPWMQVPLTADADRVGRVRLDARASGLRPASEAPTHLMSAQGEVAPEAGELAFPDPPPLAPDHSEALVADLDLADAEALSAEVFALHGGSSRVTELTLSAASAAAIGEGKERRLAPEDHELLLLQAERDGRLSPRGLALEIESGERRQDLEVTSLLDDEGLLLVVERGQPLSLLVRQDGVEQQLDLRSGEVERDPRAINALDVGMRRASLGLQLDASWTEVHTYDDHFGDSMSYEGLTYELTGSCDEMSVSPVSQGWAPPGKKTVEVVCPELATDYLADLTTEAVEASGRLHVDGEVLTPSDVTVEGDGTWSWDVGATYRFEVPVDAKSATFVLEGHAEVDGVGLTAFSPAASEELRLGEGGGP